MTSSSSLSLPPTDAELAEYFAGEGSAELETRIATWRQGDPEAYERMNLIWVQAEGPQHRPQTRIFVERLHTRLRAEAHVEAEAGTELPAIPSPAVQARIGRPTAGRDRTVPTLPRWRTMIAPVTLMAVASAIALYAGNEWRLSRESAQPRALREFVTATGQHAVYTLPDGSRVTLAPETWLQIDTEFGKKSRNVSLVGEAFFEIKPASRHPFVVRTGNILTQVLGTSFTVQRYPSDEHVRVAVESGKVVVRGDTPQQPSVTLTAGYLGEVSASRAGSKVIDLSQYHQWRTGELVFRNVRTEEVLATLGRWYGYAFYLTDPMIAEQLITVKVRTDAPQQGIDILQAVLNVNAQIRGRAVTFTPR